MLNILKIKIHLYGDRGKYGPLPVYLNFFQTIADYICNVNFDFGRNYSSYLNQNAWINILT